MMYYTWSVSFLPALLLSLSLLFSGLGAMPLSVSVASQISVVALERSA